MPWIVKLDKESDWIGRYAIEWYKQRGNRLALVGWEGQNGKVPVEGTQVVGDNGEPAGPHHQRALLTPPGQGDRHRLGAGGAGEEGTPIRISDPSGATIPATVTHRPFTTPRREGCVREQHRGTPSRSCRRRRPPASRCERRWNETTLSAGATLEQRDGWRIATRAA
jgi:hypothetical protein